MAQPQSQPQSISHSHSVSSYSAYSSTDLSTSSHFSSCSRSLSRFESELDDFISFCGQSNSSIAGLTTREASISQLQRSVQSDLALSDGLIDREPVTRREMWRVRFRQLVERCSDCAIRLDKERRKIQTQIAKEQSKTWRAESAQRRSGGGSEAAELRAHESLTRSVQLVDELAAMGSASLEGLQRQRGFLKSAQRRLLDVATSLGLSASLLRLIERRERWNSALVYALSLLTVAIVLALYWWIRAK
jgi:hypothetical protein